jgi:hypothetical protein
MEHRILDSPYWTSGREGLPLNAGCTLWKYKLSGMWHEEVKHEHGIRKKGKALLFD